MKRSLALLALLACGDPGDPTPDEVPDAVPVSAETARARAVRVSMALRGTRPTPAELDQVARDPAALDTLADTWLTEPRFAETIRHLHADILLTRSFRVFLPARGELVNEDSMAISHTLREEPLALIEHVVMNDRPYTEIVTADYTVVSELGPQLFAGLERTSGEGEQLGRYTDGRPAAGILSTNGLWLRYQSAGANYHRQRANAVSDALLCSDFVSRDIPITGEVDLSDPDAVADALNTQAECVACHQTLDPLGAHFFPVRGRLIANTVNVAYENDCATRNAACYPVSMYFPQAEGAWRRFGLRPPGYFGQESDNLGSLGQNIADDPRFAQCTVKRFVSYFTQTPIEEVDLQTVAPLQQSFVDSGYDTRQLVREIVLSPSFVDVDAENGAGVLATRPIQMAASIEDLTGYRMVANVDGQRCVRGGVGCVGDIDLLQDDVIGFRAMAGGIDGSQVTRPTWTTTPTKMLTLSALAEEAAGHVVDEDFAEAAGDRRLLTLVESDTQDEASIRAQLSELHLRMYGEVVATEDVQIDEAWQLFQAALSRRSGAQATADAWKITLAGLLQDPRMLLY